MLDRLSLARCCLSTVVALAGGVAGCGGPPPEKKLGNPDPSGKIPAIKQAVRLHDRAAVEQLVKDLDSDDPAVRFYSIGGLQRLTGETFGYEYYHDEEQRKPALKHWQEWLEQQQR
jgi:hypothetical protein